MQTILASRDRFGLMLMDGRGVKTDACRARDYLRQAAGHASAPVPAALAYLDRISADRMCPAP